MLDVEDWAEIRRLHRSEQVPIKVIARALGISKNTVRAALRSDGPPKYVRAPLGSVVDAVEPRIRALLQTCPTMPATVIAERIGWTRGMTVMSERVRELRPIFLPPDPASHRLCGCGDRPARLLVSRHRAAGRVRSESHRQAAAGADHGQRVFADAVRPADPDTARRGSVLRLVGSSAAVGGGAKVLVWDGEGAVGEYGGGRNKLTTECQAFRGTLGAKVLILRPRDPEAKGIIERAHDYLETSFLPGRCFTGPADFNCPQRRFLPTQRPRPRPGPTSRHHRGLNTEMTDQGVNFQPMPGGQVSAAVDKDRCRWTEHEAHRLRWIRAP
jgi:hypothetical protein